MYTYWLEFLVPSMVVRHQQNLIRCKTLPSAKKAIALLCDEQRDKVTFVGGAEHALDGLLGLYKSYGKKWAEIEVPDTDTVYQKW